MFFVAVTTGAAPVLLPRIVEDFSLRISEAGVLNGAYGVGRLLAGVLLGLFGAKIRFATVLWSGVVTTALGLQITAVASSYPTLVIGRFLTGMGFGIVLFSMLFVVLIRTTADGRVKALGVLEIGIGGGMGIGAAGAGALMSWVGWREVVQGMVGLVVVAAGSCWWSRTVWASQAESRTPQDSQNPGNIRDEVASPVVLVFARLLPAYLTSLCLAMFWHGLLVTAFPLHAIQVLHLSERFVGSAVSMASWGELAQLMCMPLLLRRYGRTEIFAVSIVGIAVGGSFLFIVENPYLLGGVMWLLGMCFSAWIAPVSMLPDLHGRGSIRSGLLAWQRASAELGGVVGPIALAKIAEAWGFIPAGAAVSAAVGLSGFWLVRVYSRAFPRAHVVREPT